MDSHGAGDGHLRQSARRAVIAGILIAGLAGGLAWRSRTRVRDWQSETALWTAASQAQPDTPRPWINLAAVAIGQGDYARADADLRRARQLPSLSPEADDAIAASEAEVALAQGRLAEIPGLMGDWRHAAGSARWELCRRLPSVCR